MQDYQKKRFVLSAILPIFFVLLITLIKLVEVEFNLNFSDFGILPRKKEGLKGILFSPLIHGGWKHLFNNSIPLLILGWAIFYFYKTIALRVFLLSYLLAGVYTWISARYSYHIGASGLVYALFGFLFISGFIRKHKQLIALSFLVAFLYGSLIWGILPWDKTISWEGHFWGLVVGLLLAIVYRKKGPQRKIFQWNEEEEEEENIAKEETAQEEYKAVDFEYHFVPRKSEDDNN